MFGKLRSSIPWGVVICRYLASKRCTIFGVSGYRILSFEPEHADAVEDLPMYHADPFDRLIVAQALMEPMRLMTHDKILPRYSDSIIQI